MSREVIHSKNFVPDAAAVYSCSRRTLRWPSGAQFRIALSGGNTPRPVYTEFARIGRDLPWERFHLLSAMSAAFRPMTSKVTFRMAQRIAFSPAPVPEKSIARMRGEIDPQLAAQEYQDQLDLLAAERDETDLSTRFYSAGLGRGRPHGFAFSRDGSAR